jgi:hypothetical protein
VEAVAAQPLDLDADGRIKVNVLARQRPLKERAEDA